jgi:acetyl-CoA synthetase
VSSGVTNIESVLSEDRVFAPPAALSQDAAVKSLAELQQLRAEAAADPESFWASRAEEELHWFCEMEYSAQMERSSRRMVCWGGKIAAFPYNCLDRHLTAWRRKQSGADLGRRTRRLASAHLSTTPHRSLQVCQRAEVRRGRAG